MQLMLSLLKYHSGSPQDALGQASPAQGTMVPTPSHATMGAHRDLDSF